MNIHWMCGGSSAGLPSFVAVDVSADGWLCTNARRRRGWMRINFVGGVVVVVVDVRS